MHRHAGYGGLGPLGDEPCHGGAARPPVPPPRRRRRRLVVLGALAAAAAGAALLAAVLALGGDGGSPLHADPVTPARDARSPAAATPTGRRSASRWPAGRRSSPSSIRTARTSARSPPRRCRRPSTDPGAAHGHRRGGRQRRSPGRHAGVGARLPRAASAHRADALHHRHGGRAAPALEELADRGPARQRHRVGPLGPRRARRPQRPTGRARTRPGCRSTWATSPPTSAPHPLGEPPQPWWRGRGRAKNTCAGRIGSMGPCLPDDFAAPDPGGVLKRTLRCGRSASSARRPTPAGRTTSAGSGSRAPSRTRRSGWR